MSGPSDKPAALELVSGLEQLNDEQVLVTSHARLKGRGSGVEMDWTTFGVWTVRDERLVGMHNFLDRKEAVAAAQQGLA